MFEASDFAEGFPVEKANEAIATLKAKLVPFIKTEPEKDIKLYVASITSVFLQATIRRSLELIEGALMERRSERGLTSTVCSRAFWETYALFVSFSEQLIAKLKSDAPKDIAKWIGNQLLKTRISQFIGPDNQATNILTHIDRIAKDRQELRTGYDYLSDISHPNLAGLLAYYAVASDEGFSFEKDMTQRSLNLLTATVSLLISEVEKVAHLESEVAAYNKA